MRRLSCKSLIYILIVLTFVHCKKADNTIIIDLPPADLSKANIIPQPIKIEPTDNAFALNGYTKIITTTNDSTYNDIATYVKESLKKDFGIDFKTANELRSGTIVFNSTLDSSENPEAYSLNIVRDSIYIYSNTPEGAFRAIQTFRQLIPEKSMDTVAEFKVWSIPTGIITDEPVFEYRGTMLDVARHFFTVEEVKNYIDLLAYYKINHLHLHLSDDQGWRIEIKSWPKLTEIGGKSEVGGGEGGYYSQDDYEELVAYAADRYITIVPEIDMPGHTNASYVAYPFLNGTGKTAEPYTGMRVGFSTFDTRKDSVYAFIDDVIREISAISPGPYFHIGGDESHSTKKEDYLYFINKVEPIVNKYNKRLIGWDEVANADLGSSSIAQYWNNEQNAKTAVSKSMKLILSPAKKMYLDMKYEEDSEFGLTWAGYIPVDSAYNWSPLKYIKDLPRENILGIEAPLWSETISNGKELQYLAFPRIIGYAEIGWTADENRDWIDYQKRLKHHRKFLDNRSINYYDDKNLDW